MKTFISSPQALRIGIKLFIKNILCAVTAICFVGNLSAHTLPAYGKISHSDLKKIEVLANPAISYSSPQNYFKGNAIAPLSPVSSGVASLGYSTSLISLGSGFNAPSGVATDAGGNVYIADYNNNVVKKIPVGGGAITTIGAGFSFPAGVAVDRAGNVYVADYGNGMVKEILASNGSTISLGTGFSRPQGVAVDAAGNVFVADYAASQVLEIPIGGGAQINIGSGINEPYGVAVDGAGNVYVASHGFGEIIKVPVGGGVQTIVGTGGVYGVATDAGGDVFYTDYATGALTELLANGGGTIIIASSFTHPSGVAIDYKGNLYVTDAGVYKIVPIGGYFISQFLPQGLSFNSSTGVISGTPTAASPATNYTVTGYNSTSSGSTVLSLQVISLSLSYTSPLVYTNGVPVSPVSPTVTGTVAAPAYSQVAVNFASGFTHPRGITTDGAGNIFISDLGTSLITEYPASGSASFTVGSGFLNPDGVAVDGQGNVYVSDYGHAAVKKVLAGVGSITTIGTGYSSPYGVAADAAGNVYVADYLHAAVRKIPADGSATIVIGTGFTSPSGVAVDASGNVYVADFGASTVKKILAAGGTTITIGSGFVNPYGVAVDNAGNVFVADFGHNAVKEIPAGSNIPIVIAGGFSTLTGVTVGNKGIVYAADYDNTNVKSFKPVGGYYINPALPAGLHMDSGTGIVSGTPTTTSAATNYTITAYNSDGGTSCTLNIAVNALNINYASPKLYNVGTPVTPLSPNVTGSVSPAGYSTSSVIANTTVSNPTGVAVDALNNVYVIQEGSYTVTKFPVGGGASVSLGSGFLTPFSLAVDAAGNIYVADYGNNAIKKIPAGNGAPVTLGSGFSGPFGVAVDAAGNVYVADTGNNAVKEIPAGGGAVIALGSGFNFPTAVAVDGHGNVYVADDGNSMIKKIPAGNGAPVALATGLSSPYGIAVDAMGNVFYGERSLNDVKEISGGTGSPVTIATGFNLPYNVAVNAAGKLYVADFNNHAIKTITPTGGYYLDNALPAGLNFSNATGTISGTPTVLSPATNYTVTAYNGSGSASAVVNIKVSAAAIATLSNLAINPGTLKPVFASGTNAYTTNVGNGITSITLTPTATDPMATIKVNGIPVANGTATGALPLTVGSNTLTTLVTAQDGTTTQTYTLTVTRAASANAKLLTLTTSNGALTPAFSNTVTSYTKALGNAVTSITITPTTVDANATVTVNSIAVTSGTASGSIALNVGDNVISTVVTAQDGVTKITYSITVNRGPSADALLSNLAISTGTLKPVFATATTAYTVAVGNGIASTTITPTTNDPGATVKVNGVTVASGSASGPIALVVGANVITTVITAQNGVTTKNYKVTVTRAPSTNAKLLTLTTSNGVLSPAFNNSVTSYTRAVPNSATSITFTPTTVDKTATVTVNGSLTVSGTVSTPQPLVVGANVVNIIVTAQDGITAITYTVTVTRAMGSMNNIYGEVGVEKPVDGSQLTDDGVNVHQGISPNGDGINDFLVIEGIGNYPDNRLQILNRSGQLIFEAKSYDNSSKIFDGHSNKSGTMQLPGTYFYSLDYTVKGVARHKTGFIVLKY